MNFAAFNLPASVNSYVSVDSFKGVYLACTDGPSTKIARSLDGLHWSNIELGFLITGGILTHTDNNFCLIPGGLNANSPPASDKVYTSPDGLAWTERTLPITIFAASAACHDNTILILADKNGIFNPQNAYCLSNDNGVTWSSGDFFEPLEMPATPLQCSNRKFFYISSDEFPYVSTDGVNWVKGNRIDVNVTFYGTEAIGSNEILFIVFSQGGLSPNLTHNVYISFDGLNWQLQGSVNAPNISMVSKIVYDGTNFITSGIDFSVGGGNSFTVPMVSKNGLSWAIGPQVFALNATVEGLAASKGKMVIVAFDGEGIVGVEQGPIDGFQLANFTFTLGD